MRYSTIAALTQPPLTAPPVYATKVPYARGDLIEYGSGKSLGNRLAIIQKALQSDFGGRLSLVGVSREDGQRWLAPRSIHFHHPGYATLQGDEPDIPSLKAILDDFARTPLKQEIMAAQEAISAILKRHEGGTGLDQLIFEDDLLAEMFGADGASCKQRYALFTAISHLPHSIIRDGSSRNPNAYRPFPRHIKKAIHACQNAPLPVLDRFREMLRANLFASDRLLSSTLDLFGEAFMSIVEFYAANHSYLRLNRKLEDLVRQVLQGIWPYTTASDLALLGERLTRYPRAQGLYLRQSVLDQVPVFAPCKETPKPLLDSLPTKYAVMNTEMVAIDSPETVEVDDALSVSGCGEWLHIHVADPALLIQPHGAADMIARSRTSTVYLPELSLPMLPKEFGAATSLDPTHPSNPTLTFSVKLGSDGNIIDYHIRPILVSNVVRKTFAQVNSQITEPKFATICKMADLHRQYRQGKGLQGIHIPKGKVKVSSDGCTRILQDVLPSESPSHSMVSECMVMAGRVAAMFAAEHNLPIPFRYHLAPEPSDPISTSDPLIKSLRLMEGMRPAAIDLVPRPHWAMGLSSYTKATSPLRRYGDLLLHQQLKALLLNQDTPYTIDHLREIIPRMYRQELYIKRLQTQSNRFWMLMHLQREVARLSEDGGRVMQVTGVVMASSTRGATLASVMVYLDMPYGVTCFTRILSMNAVEPWHRYNFKVLRVDAHAGQIDLQIVES